MPQGFSSSSKKKMTTSVDTSTGAGCDHLDEVVQLLAKHQVSDEQESSIEISNQTELGRGAAGAVVVGRLVQTVSDSIPTTLRIVDEGVAKTEKVLFCERVENQENNNGSQVVAIKTIPKKQADLAVSQAMAELAVVKKVSKSSSDSIFLPKFYFALETENNFMFAMEPLLGGDLFDRLAYEVSLKEAKCILKEILSALAFLHSNHILHGDIKPENVVFDSHGHAHLVDFGNAHIFDIDCDGKVVPTITQGGTLGYCAPEILRRDQHGFETDFWSIGVLAFELVFGYLPWYSDDQDEMCASICVEPPAWPTELQNNPSFYNLVSRLLEKHQGKRLTSFEQISNHNFFAL